MSGHIATSFRLDCKSEELDVVEQAMTCFDEMCIGRMSASDLVDAALPDPKGTGRRMSGLRQALSGHLGTPLGLVLTRVGKEAIVHGQGRLNLPAMAEIVRLLASSTLPLEITWSSSFDPLTPGSALGGWLVVHEHRTVEGDVRSAARGEISRVGRRREPTEIQNAAIAAYDEDGQIREMIAEADGDVGDHLLSKEIRDTLAAFVYIEAGDAATTEEAVEMMRSAASQLETVAYALEVEDRGT